MFKKKITKKSLEELAKVMPIIPEWEMRTMIGGTGSMVITGITGFVPEFTYEEYDQMMANGTWQGGVVMGIGYISFTTECTITGVTGSSSNEYSSSIAYGAGAGTGYSEPPAVSGGGGPSIYCKISYGGNADSSVISSLTKNVLTKVFGNTSITITSTTRTPRDQARIMCENIMASSVAKQKDIYAETPDLILDKYNPRKNKEENIEVMTAEIYRLGPYNVSKHCADHNVLNVFDIAVSSISGNIQEKKAELERLGHKVLYENGCLHVEVKQK